MKKYTIKVPATCMIVFYAEAETPETAILLVAAGKVPQADTCEWVEDTNINNWQVT